MYEEWREECKEMRESSEMGENKADPSVRVGSIDPPTTFYPFLTLPITPHIMLLSKRLEPLFGAVSSRVKLVAITDRTACRLVPFSVRIHLLRSSISALRD